MRILHVHQQGRFFGGVEQILHDTAAGLAAQGLAQALLHDDAAPDDAFLAPFAAHGRDPELLQRFRPDAILVHKPPQEALIESLSRRCPTTRMVHDHDLVCLRRHKYFPVSGRICRSPAGIDCYLHLCFVTRDRTPGALPVALRSVRRQRAGIAANAGVRTFIVGSQWMRQSLAGNGIDPDRVRVIHPIPAALAAPRALPPAAAPAILYVGQVIRGKGVDLLLRALAVTPGAWRATVVGDGNHLPACRDLARRLGLEQRVRFTGRVAHADLESHYASASFTAVPSRWPEPFGMVGIEAMARGRPVVGFDAGGIAEWLRDGDTGLLVPAGNVTALAAAMARLLADPAAAAAMGARAARHVAAQFSHQDYLQQMRRTLEDTV